MERVPRPALASRRPTGAGLTGAADLRDADVALSETASSRDRLHARCPLGFFGRDRRSRVTAKARNRASERRFPASREPRRSAQREGKAWRLRLAVQPTWAQCEPLVYGRNERPQDRMASETHSRGNRPSRSSSAVSRSRSKLWALTPSRRIGRRPASVLSSKRIARATNSSALSV